MALLQIIENNLDNLKSTSCVPCKRSFFFPFNYSRHRWRHKSNEEEWKKWTEDFVEFWDNLDEEKAHEIISDNSLKLKFTEVDVNELVELVSTSLITGRPFVKHASALYNAVFGTTHLTSKEIFKALFVLSERNFLRYTREPAMLEIMARHANNSKDSREDSLLALFAFLVEHCLVKACNDFVEVRALLISTMLIEAENAVQNQMHKKAKRKKKKSARQKQTVTSKDPLQLDMATDLVSPTGHEGDPEMAELGGLAIQSGVFDTEMSKALDYSNTVLPQVRESLLQMLIFHFIWYLTWPKISGHDSRI